MEDVYLIRMSSGPIGMHGHYSMYFAGYGKFGDGFSMCTNPDDAVQFTHDGACLEVESEKFKKILAQHNGSPQWKRTYYPTIVKKDWCKN